jgi:hypothetical protein
MTTFPSSSHSRLLISEVQTASKKKNKKKVQESRGVNQNDMRKEEGKESKIR